MPSECLKQPTARRLMVVAAILVGLIQPTMAEKARRSTRKSQPVPEAPIAPDITATIPKTKPAPAPAAEVDPPLKPFNLPVAPRSRMHACGAKWQEVKMSGRAGDQTWRDFATKCLTATQDVGKKSQP